MALRTEKQQQHWEAILKGAESYLEFLLVEIPITPTEGKTLNSLIDDIRRISGS